MPRTTLQANKHNKAHFRAFNGQTAHSYPTQCVVALIHICPIGVLGYAHFPYNIFLTTKYAILLETIVFTAFLPGIDSINHH